MRSSGHDQGKYAVEFSQSLHRSQLILTTNKNVATKRAPDQKVLDRFQPESVRLPRKQIMRRDRYRCLVDIVGDLRGTGDKLSGVDAKSATTSA